MNYKPAYGKKSDSILRAISEAKELVIKQIDMPDGIFVIELDNPKHREAFEYLFYWLQAVLPDAVDTKEESDRCPHCGDRATYNEILKDDTGRHYNATRCSDCDAVLDFDYEDTDANWQDEVARADKLGDWKD